MSDDGLDDLLEELDRVQIEEPEDEVEEDTEDMPIFLDVDEADLIDSYHDLIDIRNFKDLSSPDPNGVEAAEVPENNGSEGDDASLERIRFVPKVGAIRGSRPDANYAWRPDYEIYFDGNDQGICGKHLPPKNIVFVKF